MNITVIGTGYVGLVTGVCLSNVSNKVICLDTDKNKILPLIDLLDYILIMSVFPGQGGQSFIYETLTLTHCAFFIRCVRRRSVMVVRVSF